MPTLSAEGIQEVVNAIDQVQYKAVKKPPTPKSTPVNVEGFTNVAKLFGLDVSVELSDAKQFIAGVECEIENVKFYHNVMEDIGFHVINDGSLRNGGFEFLSRPLYGVTLVDSFKRLHASLVVKDDSFSQRTSTHVHVNCCSLKPKAVRQMVLLYALYEEFFFMLVKPERRDNIHCVPLTETYLPVLYKHDIANMRQRWSKYSALNLIRLKDLGTLEFRHLHGTNNGALFEAWIKTLENLWTLAQTEPLTKSSLTVDNLHLWYRQLFKDSGLPQHQPMLLEIIRNSLIDVKFAFV